MKPTTRSGAMRAIRAERARSASDEPLPPRCPLPRVVPTAQLVLDALRAIGQPHRPVWFVEPDARLRYQTLVPALAVGGIFFIVLHSRTVVGNWVWELPYGTLMVAQYAMAGVWNWLLAGLALRYTFRWTGRGQPVPTVAQIDAAIVSLWMTWVLMPLFDVVHAFGVPTVLLVSRLPWAHFFVGHVSSLVMAPIRAIQLYAILRVLGQVARGRALALALVLPFAARFLIEPIGGFFFLLAGRLGYQVNLWVGQYVMLSLTLLVLVAWRIVMDGRRPLYAWRVAGVLGVGLLWLTGLLWGLSWGIPLASARQSPAVLEPITISQAPRPDAGQGHGWVWEAEGEREASLVRAGPLLDGINHAQDVTIVVPPIETAFARAAAAIHCEVLARARDGLPDDGFPRLQCGLAIRSADGEMSALPGPVEGDLDGETVSSSAVWDQRHPEWNAILAAGREGRLVAQVTLGVHSGGDYTSPDALALRRVRIWVDRSDRR